MIFSFFLALHFSFSTTDGAGRDAEGQQDFWRMQTYADVCRRMLTSADVCRRMLTVLDTMRTGNKTYADVCWRMLTYADGAGRDAEGQQDALCEPQVC
jgi:hypothetical protein